MSAKPLELYPLTKLNSLFSSKFGEEWYSLEDETLSMELGVKFSDLFLQKIRLLRVLLNDAKSGTEQKAEDDQTGWLGFEEPRIESDPLFFIHASDIINNQIVNPQVISLPTSLEAAYALYELSGLPIKFKYTTMIKEMCEHILKQDGFAAPVGPFSFIDPSRFVDADKIEKEDADNKTKAIRAYIYDMENVGG